MRNSARLGVRLSVPWARISTGPGFIEEIQDFLFDTAGSNDVEQVSIGVFDDFGDLTPNVVGGFRLPFLELLIQSFR